MQSYTSRGHVDISSVRVAVPVWQYSHWHGDFIPSMYRKVSGSTITRRHFDTVEINNTFYRLPDASTFAAWRRRAANGFVYAVKASRLLERYRVALCLHDMRESASGKLALGPFVDVRFNGVEKYG
jgi:uncharacterized protein YecE (DUF72 family)